MKSLSIIVPVYGDWPSLKKNIHALISYIPDNTEVFLVNDCGPKADKIEKKILKLINGKDRFHYSRNDSNKGFVKNCNDAVAKFALNKDATLLLNSDAIITDGAIEELRQVLFSEEEIAAVCPRSNNATIFTIPFNKTGKSRLSMRASYAYFKKVKNQLSRFYISPLAHGFCMMIKTSVIKEIGLFDTIYGAGYGEESDFCMRALEKGYKCATANRSYVFHYGSKSFSEAVRDEKVRKNEKILLSRYPSYAGLIYAYTESVAEIEQSL